ncbi:MAG: NADH-quinone oxidoreductase subunit K [Euryarchaeota archaeon RBG_19FT_COMBO_56_21]|nr:MAG: NADH-quinone oxidoreductase subunit K [Euryarchaeota archaeon RBG_19FT_COMBO_56_21]
MIPIEYWLILSSLLLAVGVYGVMTRRNAIVVLMSIEIMLNAANINLVAFSSYYSSLHPTLGTDATGQAFALFSIAIAAAEVAVGLAILLSVYRRYQTIDVDKINILRW